jgi:hypothetical protein
VASKPTSIVAKLAFVVTKPTFVVAKRAFVTTKHKTPLVMVMLDMFRGMNLWFNSFTFFKLGISMFVGLVDC